MGRNKGAGQGSAGIGQQDSGFRKGKCCAAGRKRRYENAIRQFGSATGGAGKY